MSDTAMHPADRPPNRLATATSPYLQQHAHNPVDWWPWCDKALALAREQNKPILLSIGYSACHWCHVMAHESFEDSETAELMNRLYINIKVDREERPDLDKIYQSAHQLLSRRPGGWPLTVFLTPEDQTPFFAGTYFPREPRHGLPAFKDLLRGIEQALRQQAGEIREQNRSLIQALESLNPAAPGDARPLDGAPLEIARRQLAESFDATYAGFGQAPKFPHPTNLEFLLRHWATTASPGGGDVQALRMADTTLRRMASGGLNDQLGGGFCRYSVDERWMIPHFEKMLYDNGPLLALYCDAWQATGDPRHRQAALATADWVMREMQSPEGGYYSTLDADSEGEEGRYYVWSREEVRALLEADEYALFAACYGLDRPANFEGKWHLHTYLEPETLAERQRRSLAAVGDLLEGARRKLLAAREQRVRPGRDEKVLTAWNALMIKGMARAARVLERPDYLDSAQRALDFIRSTLWRDGHLLATYKDGKAHLNAYLDDYANLIDALLELLQARWARQDLEFALALSQVLLGRFQDRELGGFFFTSDDHERLIHRPKPLGDDSLPAGNGVAARVLQRLGHLTGDARLLEAADRTLQLAAESIRRIPYAHTSLLLALEEQLHPTETIVIRGAGEGLARWLARSHANYAPRRLAVAIPADETELPGALGGMAPRDEPLAYRCSGSQCGPPFTDFAAFEAALGAAETTPTRL